MTSALTLQADTANETQADTDAEAITVNDTAADDEATSDTDSTMDRSPIHGEIVQVRAGAPEFAPSGALDLPPPTPEDTLLYPRALFAEHNEQIAIATRRDEGVFADTVVNEIVFIFYSPSAVGLLCVRPEAIIDLDTVFSNARAQFIKANGSTQGIHIRLGHNPAAFRAETMASVQNKDSKPEVLRTRLKMPSGLDGKQVYSMAVERHTDRRQAAMLEIAENYGIEGTILDIRHGSIYVNHQSIDLFKSEPYARLPDDVA